jgi:deazaflavin-dependent oxidoreductase (nitroreductase family)
MAELDLSLFGDAHVQRYLDTDGAEGHIWNGVPCAVLFTTGRKSGAQRRHALIYGRRGDDVVFVASKGGAPDNPLWYENLAADPAVEVQVLADRFTGTARTATGDERAELWSLMTGIWPSYDDYQSSTDREIPVVVVERS